MKKIFVFGLLLLGIQPFAQITITDSDFPEGGDTALVSISTDIEFDFESTGEDYIWDYSALESSEQRIDTFFDIDAASVIYQVVFNNGWFDPDYQADYYTHFLDFVIPSSDIFELPISNPVGFTKIESDKVEAIGIGLEIGGVKVPVKNEIIDIEYELPMNYEDDWVSNSFFEIDLNPAFDGILRRHQERTTQVDGWGEITTPLGTYEVLRTFATIEFTDSLKITIGEVETWLELPTPSQVVYSWWAEDQKVPVLEVVIQDVFGTETVSSIEYKDRWLGYANVDESVNVDLNMYPNPASKTVQISGVKNMQSLQLISLTGQSIGNWSWDAATNQIDVSALVPGIYIVQITLDNAILTRELIIE